MNYLSKIRRPLRRMHRHTVLAFSIGCVSGLLVGIGVVLIPYYLRTPLSPQTTTIAARWLPPSVQRWHGPIAYNAQKYGIDPTLIAIIMTLESGGNPNANSGSAQGLLQITPATAQDIAHKYLKKPVQSYNIWDPATNIEFGTAYLSYLRDTFGDRSQYPSWNETVELIAAGYNGGPGAAASVRDGGGLRDIQTIVYSRDAFTMWRERHAADSPTFDRWKERGGQQLLDAAANPSHHP